MTDLSGWTNPSSRLTVTEANGNEYATLAPNDAPNSGEIYLEPGTLPSSGDWIIYGKAACNQSAGSYFNIEFADTTTPHALITFGYDWATTSADATYRG